MSPHLSQVVLVLGSDGMLGHRVAQMLQSNGVAVITTSRSTEVSSQCLRFDATRDTIEDLLEGLRGRVELIVNAIGVIKPQIDENRVDSRLNALEVNSVFPFQLALGASKIGARVIQIATDCVFSGNGGSYVETSPHDAPDLYGQSKSMGEVTNPSMMHLRCSIVGTELVTKRSLWEWVRSQPIGATVRGFRNHLWNGITTDAFGQLCVGILKNDLHHPGLHHVVPKNQVSKAQLVEAIAHKSGRGDLNIQIEDVIPSVNRTLATTNPKFNEELWFAAGYSGVPTIQDLISQYQL